MGIGIRDVTIVVPTRSRKERVGTLLSKLQHPHDRILLVVDKGREQEDLPSNLNGQIVVNSEPNCGSIKAIETGIVAAKTSHVLFINDDMDLGEGCIEEAIRYYNERFGDQDGVVGLNHGLKWEHIACAVLMPRKFYMDHCYPSPYKRYCIDNEWTEKARALNMYAKAENARLLHDWPAHDEAAQLADWHIFESRINEFKVRQAPHKKLFIGVPVFGGVDIHFFDSMLRFLQQDHGINCKIGCVAGDSLVPRARNTLTIEFLKSDCTHMLFIDSDLVFSAEHIRRMLAHDEDIVGGFYPKKAQGDVEFVFNCTTPPSMMDDRRLTPVKYIGTGFMMIKRGVIERMIAEYGDELIFQVDGKPGVFGFDFWKVGVYKYKDGTRRYLSEDWYFCQMAIDLGYKVYGDNAVILKHSGSAVYPLRTQEEKLFGRLPAPGPHQTAVVQPDSPLVEATA